MSESKPNIILILIEQLRGDCIAMDERAPKCLQTPNLDFLARHGVRFSHAYSEVPTCAPARRVIMSGMAPAANGSVGFEFADWDPPCTLAGELSGAGYQTEMIGKLHLHPKRKRYGFDHMWLADGLRGDPKINDYVDWLIREKGRSERDVAKGHGVSTNSFVGRPNHLPEEEMFGYWCVEKAMEFLEKRDPSCPFFLNLSFFEPHPPLTPPPHYFERYLGADLPEPFVGDWVDASDIPEKGVDQTKPFKVKLDRETMRRARAGYYGLINFVDDQIGRLIEYARSTIQNCFIVVTSDHGEMLGDHHLFCKSWPYESSARIPLIIYPPESWGRKGSVCTFPVGLQDIMPTILAAAGIDIPKNCTGKSLLNIVMGKNEPVRDVIHGEHYGDYNYEWAHQYLTDGCYKYIWFSQTGEEQFFNLTEDPEEKDNLAGNTDCSEELCKWRKKMIECLKDRPEGFTDGRKLIAGKKQYRMIPGYKPDKTYKFL